MSSPSHSAPQRVIEDRYLNKSVRVPKGTLVKRYGPDWPIKIEPSKRSQVVRIAHVGQTYVEWLGAGGYSRTASMDDVEVLSA